MLERDITWLFMTRYTLATFSEFRVHNGRWYTLAKAELMKWIWYWVSIGEFGTDHNEVDHDQDLITPYSYTEIDALNHAVPEKPQRVTGWLGSSISPDPRHHPANLWCQLYMWCGEIDLIAREIPTLGGNIPGTFVILEVIGAYKQRHVLMRCAELVKRI